VSDTLADAAIEAHAVIFEGPRLERQAELAAERLGPWLARAAADASPPPQTVLLDLAATPRHLFDRMGRWLFESDARRRHLALSAYLLRLLAPDEPLALTACSGSVESQRVDLPEGRVVVGVTGTGADAARTVPEDERLFVLAEVRGRTADESDDAARHVAGFERRFYQATSALRALRNAHDPRRRLHWNRIAIAVGPAIALDRRAIEDIARRL